MNGIWDNGRFISASTLDDIERKMRRYGFVLAMRLLQSNLVLDDEEIRARDYFIAINHGGTSE